MYRPAAEGFICSRHAWAERSSYPHTSAVCPYCGEGGLWCPSGWWTFFKNRNADRAIHCIAWRVRPLQTILEQHVVHRGNSYMRITVSQWSSC